jgi:putative transposase
LRQAEGGVPVAELRRVHGMNSASIRKWRAKYGGMDVSMISQMKTLEDIGRRWKTRIGALRACLRRLRAIA